MTDWGRSTFTFLPLTQSFTCSLFHREIEGKCVCTCVWGGITGGGFSWWCIARPTFLTAAQRHKETAQLINCTKSQLVGWQSDDQMLPFSTAGGGEWIFSCSRRKNCFFPAAWGRILHCGSIIFSPAEEGEDIERMGRFFFFNCTSTQIQRPNWTLH